MEKASKVFKAGSLMSGIGQQQAEDEALQASEDAKAAFDAHRAICPVHKE